MSMITLDGHVFLVTGDIPNMSRAEVTAAIHAAGGKTASSASRRVDVVVVGKNAGELKLQKVRALGLSELDSAQFLTLLRDGELLMEEAPALIEAPVGESVSALRSAFDGPPSPETWHKVTAALDEVEADRADELATYALGHIRRWPRDATQARWSSTTAFGALDVDDMLCGDLRLAPLPWTRELLQGEHHPKHALIHALSLEDTKANATMAAALLTSPHLAQLRALDCGRDLKLARGFFKKLAASPLANQLDTLIYYPLKPGGGEELAKGAFGALKTLHLRAIVYSRGAEADTDIEALMAAKWLGQLETLESSLAWSTGWSRGTFGMALLVEHAEKFTSLKHLILGDGLSDELLDSPLRDQLESLTWPARAARTRDHIPDQLMQNFKRLAERKPAKLKHVDISQLLTFGPSTTSIHKRAQKVWTLAESGFKGHQAEIVQALLKSGLVEQLDTVTVGPHANPRTRESFPAHITVL